MHQDSDKNVHSENLPEELEHLSDDELSEIIWDKLVEQGQIETEGLSIHCQDGVVAVDGLLPSAGQYHQLIGVLRDELNLENVVDRVRVQDEILLSDDEEELDGGWPTGSDDGPVWDQDDPDLP